MLRPRDALLWGLLCLGRPGLAAPPSAGTSPVSGEAHHRAAPAQLHQQQSHSQAHAGRKLTGRFLHITDFHPDPFYKTYSSTASTAACHRKRGPAGVYGAETSGCDSPVSLVNQTFDWIRDNIKNDIDFVIWTGDSARHDNDEKIPRTQKQIIQQNELIINKFAEVFARKPDDGRNGGPEEDLIVPIVPTFGNNDIMPHNIFLSGPNKWTMKYLDMWRNFIPEAQRHQFQQGGWFFVEVIPNKLAVFSLNTMYFFNSNSGVDGCANKHEPGYEHMEWLRIQLQIMRERGMKAILMGHVPPARVNSKESWDETCWQKYTLWQRQYRDVIVSSLYGHMNIDHFMLQDFKQLKKGTKKGLMSSAVTKATVESTEDLVPLFEDGEVTVASASDYLLDLRQVWAKLPIPSKSGKSKSQALDANEEVSMWQWLISKLGKSKKPKDGKSGKKKYLDKIGGKFAERFSLTMVSPSVVPNYFPTLRIFEYNITGLEDVILQSTQNNPDFVDGPNGQVPMVDDLFTDDEDYLAEVKAIVEIKKKHKERDSLKKQKKKKKYKFKVPEGPSKSSPPGPAYSPQSLTLLSYKQFFANLTEINNDFVEAHTTTTPNEDTPYRIFGLEVDENGKIENNKWKEGKHKHHQGKKPRPKPHPKEFKFEIEYDTRDDKHFPDLTVRHYVEHARRIAHGKNGGKALVESELEGEALDDEYVYDIEQEESIEPFGSQDTENDEDSDHDTDIDEEDIETNKKSKGKKKKKKHPEEHKNSKEWITFVRRAFVSTMDPHEIERVFGDQVGVVDVDVDVGEQDLIEL